MVGRAVLGEPLHAPYGTSTTTLKNRIAAFSAADTPSTPFERGDNFFQNFYTTWRYSIWYNIRKRRKKMNPFKYGCVVEGEYFCPRPQLHKQLAAYMVGHEVGTDILKREIRLGQEAERALSSAGARRATVSISSRA